MNKLSIGTWQSLPNESIAEIFANAGYDWIVIDLEHSCININQAEQLIRVIDLAGSKPFVRLSGHDATQIKRVLDAGAKGILAPMVETLHQIEGIISACRYPPNGKRGMGLARAQGYGESIA
jgi:2-dehydro-3-deoxyglucarate aldolase